jgi:hypothetical protein
VLSCTLGEGCRRPARSPLSLARSSASPYCHDETGYLGDTAEALSVSFENFFAKKDIEFTVVVLESLQGESIKRAGGRLLETWRVGADNHGRGVLLLLALRERQVRMEVSYALEPILTDITCGRLIRDQIEPFLRQPGFLALALQGAAIFVSDRMNLEQDPVAREILRGWEREDGSPAGPALGGGAGNSEEFEFAVGAERKTLLSEAERRLSWPTGTRSARCDGTRTLSSHHRPPSGHLHRGQPAVRSPGRSRRWTLRESWRADRGTGAACGGAGQLRRRRRARRHDRPAVLSRGDDGLWFRTRL